MARTLLQRLAIATERQPPLGDGRYRYHRTANWYLQTTIYDRDTASSVVVPAVTERWTAPDGSGMVREAQGEPVDARPPGPDTDRRAVDELPDADAETTAFEPGELYYAPTSSLPRDPDALRRVLLAHDDGEVPEHAVLFVASRSWSNSSGWSRTCSRRSTGCWRRSRWCVPSARSLIARAATAWRWGSTPTTAASQRDTY